MTVNDNNDSWPLFDSEQFQLIMLRLETCSLLHDIGKYALPFLKAGTAAKSGDITAIHSSEFVAENRCNADLLKILTAPLPDGWCQLPGEPTALKTLGDLVKLHHYKESVFEKHFGAAKTYPLPLYLMMYADTIDSASSKGGGKTPKKGAVKIDNHQQPQYAYLATPAGKFATSLHLQQDSIDKLEQDIDTFQAQLAQLLAGVSSCNLKELQQKRLAIRTLLAKHLSTTVAETRLPNNDVSLWQHLESSAAIFKALLAQHLLQQDNCASDAKGNLAYYREKMGILSIHYDENQLVDRADTPKEIIGQRQRLDQALDKLQSAVEEEFTLGNLLYRDGNGSHFLLPDLTQLSEALQTTIKQKLTTKVEDIFNRPDTTGGAINWQLGFLPIEQQIMNLHQVMCCADQVSSGYNFWARGPKQPQWMEHWEKEPGTAICPHCGLRPVTARAVRKGSDTAGGRCSYCNKIAHEAQGHNGCVSTTASEYATTDLNKLGNNDENRLALIQGIIDVSPFLSGEALGCALSVCPHHFAELAVGNNWQTLLQTTDAAWAALFADKDGKQAITNLQKVMQDSYLGGDEDGRSVGCHGQEKAQNYLKDTVLTAPYNTALKEDDPARVLLYSLRQHPSPSRLCRHLSNNRNWLHQGINYCEQHRINYVVLGCDQRRVQIIVPAGKARAVMLHMQQRFNDDFAHIRHMMPVHISASVFRKKSPLYVAIDAARRFETLAQQLVLPQSWRLVSISKNDNGSMWHLTWASNSNAEEVWHVPVNLYDGRNNEFYSWYWPATATRHPLHISQLEAGMKINIYPSYFDYEVLDSTVRRYDIRLEKDGRRPHMFMPHGGPRPYLLSSINDWQQQLDGKMEEIHRHQRKQMQENLAWIHRDWSDENAKEARDTLCADIVNKSCRQNNEHLIAAARDGALFDLMEWQDLLEKH